jgi:hypothetical protein
MAIFRLTALGLVAVLATAMLPAAAADNDWAEKSVNNPADTVGLWGTAKLEPFSDRSAPGGTFKRITILHKPVYPWDVGAYVVTTKPVKKGDVLLLVVWARAVQLPAQSDFISTIGQFNESTVPNRHISDETTLMIGRGWKLYYVSATADKDFAAGSLSVGIGLGGGEQAVDFASAFIVDYGPGYDTNKLPHN